jgi:hypothetical protein
LAAKNSRKRIEARSPAAVISAGTNPPPEPIDAAAGIGTSSLSSVVPTGSM